MKVASLFSGAGGMDLGLQQASIDRVLEYNLPDVIIDSRLLKLYM